MSRIVVNPGGCPSQVPLSQAIIANGFVFVSGQVGRDPDTRRAEEGVMAQTERCFQNLRVVLEAADVGFENVVKATVFLKHASDFAAMNDVYRRHFPEDPPARSTVEAKMMADELLVEIEVIAAL